MAEHLHLTVRLSAAALAAAPALPGRLAAAITGRYRADSPSGAIPAPPGGHAELYVYRDHYGPAPSVVHIQLADDEAPPGDTSLVIILPADVALQQHGSALDRLVLDRLADAGLLPSQLVVPDAQASGPGVYSDAEESEVERRLAALGYIE